MIVPKRLVMRDGRDAQAALDALRNDKEVAHSMFGSVVYRQTGRGRDNVDIAVRRIMIYVRHCDGIQCHWEGRHDKLYNRQPAEILFRCCAHGESQPKSIDELRDLVLNLTTQLSETCPVAVRRMLTQHNHKITINLEDIPWGRK